MNRPILNTMTINQAEYVIVTGENRALCQREVLEVYPMNLLLFHRCKMTSHGCELIVRVT